MFTHIVENYVKKYMIDIIHKHFMACTIKEIDLTGNPLQHPPPTLEVAIGPIKEKQQVAPPAAISAKDTFAGILITACCCCICCIECCFCCCVEYYEGYLNPS